MIVNVLYADIKNLNDRIYPIDSFNEIIKIFENRCVVYGQLTNKENLQPLNNDIIYNDLSHIINRIFISGNILKAEISFLNNKNGKFLKENIDDYVFLTRAFGYIKNDIVEITDFFTIDAIIHEYDSYPEQRIRERKLTRLLK